MIKLDEITLQYNRLLIKQGSMRISGDQMTLITGASGSGKSTLLYHIALISLDQKYCFEIDQMNVLEFNLLEVSNYQRYHIGYVMQDYTLFEQFDVLGNLQLYASIVNATYTIDEYIDILSSVQLDISLHRDIQTLSGGERQRLAIACVLCKKPDILLLDEVTSALDNQNGNMVLKVLKTLAHEKHVCVILASHSEYAKEYADVIYKIENTMLIRENQANSDFKDVWKKRKETDLSLPFYINYIRYFFKKFKSLNITILLVLIITILLSTITMGLIEQYGVASKHAMLKLCNNQIFVTTSSKTQYIEDKLSVFTSKDQNKLEHLCGDAHVHPFIYASAGIAQERILVLPYYNEADMVDKTNRKLDLSNQKGMYITSDVFSLLNKNSIPTNQETIDIFLNVTQDGSDKELAVTIKSPIKGVLEKNVKAGYTKQNSKIIYVYYEDIEKAYDGISDSKEFKGYTLTTDNFDDLLTLSSQLKRFKFGVNENFADLQSVEQMSKTITYMKVGCMAIVILLCMFLLSVVQINYFYKRNKEFALLKINGMSNKHLYKLSFLEIALKFFVACLVNAIIICTLYILNNFVLDTNIAINIENVLFLNFVILCMVIGSTMLFLKIYLKKLVPESIIRN